MAVQTPLSNQSYPLWKPMEADDLTFQIVGRFVKESEAAATKYLVGKNIFCADSGGDKAAQERIYMDVIVDPVLVPTTNPDAVYEYTIASLNHKGLQSDNTATPPTKYSAANRLRHEAGTLISMPVSAEYISQLAEDLDNTVNDKVMQAVVFNFTVDTATGDGRGYFVVPEKLNNHNLTRVHARVITAGTTGTTDIQIRNVTDTADMLSTKLTIDSTEVGSDTAAVPAVINPANAGVTTNDLLAIDVDAVSTTAAKGLIVTLEFTPQ